MVLTGDKGVALIIIDKDRFIEKCMSLLNDEEGYTECSARSNLSSLK